MGRDVVIIEDHSDRNARSGRAPRALQTQTARHVVQAQYHTEGKGSRPSFMGERRPRQARGAAAAKWVGRGESEGGGGARGLWTPAGLPAISHTTAPQARSRRSETGYQLRWRVRDKSTGRLG